jgi:hypothetical protein
MSTDLLSHAYVFVLGFAVDYIWVRVVKNVTNAKPVVAATQSVVLALPGLLGFLEIVNNKHLIPAYLAGLWLGMYVSVRRKYE